MGKRQILVQTRPHVDVEKDSSVVSTCTRPHEAKKFLVYCSGDTMLESSLVREELIVKLICYIVTKV